MWRNHHWPKTYASAIYNNKYWIKLNQMKSINITSISSLTFMFYAHHFNCAPFEMQHRNNYVWWQFVALFTPEAYDGIHDGLAHWPDDRLHTPQSKSTYNSWTTQHCTINMWAHLLAIKTKKTGAHFASVNGLKKKHLPSQKLI